MPARKPRRGRPRRPPYIVFEYVEGETLKALIREGQLEITQALAYAIELARALGAAHERGIVHRDVKPHNVLLSGEGSAKITDFGIARQLEQQGLTMDGRVLGTTDYVSPEQALGQVVTGQSDIYSLGVVLYEMLTGEVPFSGDTPVAVAMSHVREQVPDVQRLRPEVSAATAAVVDRATAQSTGAALPGHPEPARRPGGSARDRGRAHRPGHRRGHLRAALAAAAARAGACRGGCATARAGSARSFCWRWWSPGCCLRWPVRPTAAPACPPG